MYIVHIVHCVQCEHMSVFHKIVISYLLNIVHCIFRADIALVRADQFDQSCENASTAACDGAVCNCALPSISLFVAFLLCIALCLDAQHCVMYCIVSQCTLH